MNDRYASCSEYILEFCIWQGSEYAWITQGSQNAWMIPEHVWICVNMPKSIWIAFVLPFPIVFSSIWTKRDKIYFFV